MPRFTPDFLDELKNRLRPSDVIGRHIKLRKQGNEFAGLSPFSKEKTPSFFVNDQKGFYHCFSSGKHGDAISFLQETQGLSFVEAVTSLAQEAGLPIPEDNPGDQAATERRKGLSEACDAAADYFSMLLARAQGRSAADYLAGRGVTAAQISAFKIGYAPPGRTMLKDYLVNKGYREEILIEAGLLIKPDDGGTSYDRFRHRVMFPILGTQDNVIAFGGRALDPDARAKYLNSPETPLFHKGRVLYNFTKARKAAHDQKTPLIVCEGYMDVVALWGAGFRQAVAPLGTAMTENQISLLWRVSDEPVLCFDGDRAGAGAAHRAIDRALPRLTPGKSLSFAFMPDGQDPDDLVSDQGASAFQNILNNADPLVDVLWRREVHPRTLKTPEQRAWLRTHLRSLVKTIDDQDVRAAYGAELAKRLDEVFSVPKTATRQVSGQGAYPKYANTRRGGWQPPAKPTADLKRRGATGADLPEATLLLAVIRHPALLERQEQAFTDLRCSEKTLEQLHAAILDALFLDPSLDTEGLKAHLEKTQVSETLERVLSDETLNRQAFLRPEAELDEVDWGWKDALRHYRVSKDATKEMTKTAARSFTEGEDVWKAAVTAREELLNAAKSDEGAKGGAGGGDVSSEDLSSKLEQMRASIKARKKR